MAPTLAGRSLLVLCLASGLWAVGFGVGMPVVSHWLYDVHKASDSLIGFVQASYYLGLTLGSLATPMMLRRFGPRCAPVGMVLAGLSLALFPLAGGEWGWFGLRLLNGWAGAISLIPLETLVSGQSRPEKITRNFAFFAVALTLGGALGLGLGLPCYEALEVAVFYLGGMGPLLGAGLLFETLVTPGPDAAEDPGAAVPMSWPRRLLSYGTAWAQGFLEGGLLAFLTLYLVSLGLSKEMSGALMAVTTFGVVLFQLPVSWLAGRWGNTGVLVGCYLAVLAGLGLIPLLTTWFELAVVLFFFGGCCGAMYPLGLALLGEDLPKGALPRAYSWYLAIECLGSLGGASVMGQGRDYWGGPSMFAVGFVGAAGVLTLWAAGVLAGRLAGTKNTSSRDQTRRAA